MLFKMANVFIYLSSKKIFNSIRFVNAKFYEIVDVKCRRNESTSPPCFVYTNISAIVTIVTFKNAYILIAIKDSEIYIFKFPLLSYQVNKESCTIILQCVMC